MEITVPPFEFQDFDFDSMEFHESGLELSFNYRVLTENNSIIKLLNKQFNNSIIHARVHHQKPCDFISTHTDTAFIHCDVLIFRLDDNTNESRLFIEDRPIHEKQWHATLLNANDRHSINKGQFDRYSLVVWCDRQTMWDITYN